MLGNLRFLQTQPLRACKPLPWWPCSTLNCHFYLTRQCLGLIYSWWVITYRLMPSISSCVHAKTLTFLCKNALKLLWTSSGSRAPILVVFVGFVGCIRIEINFFIGSPRVALLHSSLASSHTSLGSSCPSRYLCPTSVLWLGETTVCRSLSFPFDV